MTQIYLLSLSENQKDLYISWMDGLKNWPFKSSSFIILFNLKYVHTWSQKETIVRDLSSFCFFCKMATFWKKKQFKLIKTKNSQIFI